MTMSVNNGVNNPMKNTDFNIGVIVPPDKHQKPVLYSEAEARKQFNQMNSDIYGKRKVCSFEETKKTPFLIKWGAITAAVAAAGIWIFKHFKK